MNYLMASTINQEQFDAATFHMIFSNACIILLVGLDFYNLHTHAEYKLETE